MEYTISEIGLKAKKASSMAKTVSIIRKYNKKSMSDIVNAIKSDDYVLKCTVLSHSGVIMIRKCYDELIKVGAEVKIYECDEPTTRELISNLINSHRQTDHEIDLLVEEETMQDDEEE